MCVRPLPSRRDAKALCPSGATRLLCAKSTFCTSRCTAATKTATVKTVTCAACRCSSGCVATSATALEEGDSVPHDIGFRGSKSMVRVSAMADGSPKLVVCVRLTKAHAQLLKDTPGGADTLLEVHSSSPLQLRLPRGVCLHAAAGPEPLFAKQLLLRALGHVLIHRRQQVGRAPEGSDL